MNNGNCWYSLRCMKLRNQFACWKKIFRILITILIFEALNFEVNFHNLNNIKQTGNKMHYYIHTHKQHKQQQWFKVLASTLKVQFNKSVTYYILSSTYKSYINDHFAEKIKHVNPFNPLTSKSTHSLTLNTGTTWFM